MPKRYGIKPVPDPIEVTWSIQVDNVTDASVHLHLEGGTDGPEDLVLVKGDTITMTHTVSFT